MDSLLATKQQRSFKAQKFKMQTDNPARKLEAASARR